VMDWKIKTADVWLTSVDLRWVDECDHNITRVLLVSLTDTYMHLEASLLYEGVTFARKRLELDDRKTGVNIWLTDLDQVDAAFTRVLNEGVANF